MNAMRGYTVLGSNGSDLVAAGYGYPGTGARDGLTRVEAWELVKNYQAMGYRVRVLKDLVQVWHG